MSETEKKRAAFPAFSKTSHPAVVDCIHEIQRLAEEFNQRVQQLAEEITGDRETGYSNGWLLVGKSMVGFDAEAVEKANAPGRWKKPQGGMVAPFKSNPIHDQMSAVSYTAPHIPGRGNMHLGEGVMGTGQAFELDGTVYSRINFWIRPEYQYSDMAEFGWTEIKASEFYTALESAQERAKREAS